MLAEVSSAVEFLSKLIGNRCPDPALVNQFRDCLERILKSHYENHWHPAKPHKGSGYRCIRIVEAHMDPLVKRAGNACGLSTNQLAQYLPNEITMWVDPDEVSYRIGEEGSVGMLYSKNSDNEGYSEDSYSSSDSEVCSVSSSSPSPTQEILGGSCRSETVSQYAYYNNVRNGNFGHFLPQVQFVAS